MFYAPKEKGQGLVEYALIIALIAILLIAALGFVTGGLNSVFSTIASYLQSGGQTNKPYVPQMQGSFSGALQPV